MKISMMRTGCAISLFCPFLCLQSFSLEILPHFDLKNFFLLPKLAELYFFPLYLCTLHPHIFIWHSETLCYIPCKIALKKKFNFISRWNSCEWEWTNFVTVYSQNILENQFVVLYKLHSSPPTMNWQRLSKFYKLEIPARGHSNIL